MRSDVSKQKQIWTKRFAWHVQNEVTSVLASFIFIFCHLVWLNQYFELSYCLGIPWCLLTFRVSFYQKQTLQQLVCTTKQDLCLTLGWNTVFAPKHVMFEIADQYIYIKALSFDQSIPTKMASFTWEAVEVGAWIMKCTPMWDGFLLSFK